MRKNITKIAVGIALLAIASCEDDDTQPIVAVPSASEFNALFDNALETRVQNFQFNSDAGFVSFTSEKGVVIMLNGSCLQYNGLQVTGTVDVEFVEIFDSGDMAATKKTTMGRMDNNDLALLVSDGEFYLQVTQNGQPLDLTCNFNLLVPTTLTGGFDPEMSLWEGMINADGNLVWDAVPEQAQGNGVFQEGDNYYLTFGTFGWCNIDRFYSDPRPKTTLLVDPPQGYDNENSTVYLLFDGEPNALAMLDTFTTEGFFSEHYGQIPIGLECHIIFVTEEDGMYRYAIKAETIEANETIAFALSETVVGTEAQLVAAIEAIQN